ncbi:MAG: tRNA (adenosine(37)-N6)-threonylcarbamoyltransferase complex dimerization subunit type 1 TsaB [Alphaproteobacteria bacterium]|nr:tRNA (adenosine(37)-N6)-threonylcarbamoyltransferase complex dimerization subunit type 1 TsaB [Alphaproteobacteria bacterium]
MDARMPRQAATRQPRAGPARRVLALDTCLARCAVALAEQRGAVAIVASEARAMTRGHAAMLAPMIDEALRRADWRPSDLDLVALTIGPGSFTGVRIGLAMARGLAMTLRIPVAGIATTDALLLGAAPADRGRADGVLVVAIESGRGDYFMAMPDAAPFAATARTLAERLTDRPAIVIGDGARRLVGELRDIGARAEPGSSSPEIDPAVLAAHALAVGVDAWTHRGPPRPLYLRGADVTLASGARTTADLEG